MNTSRQQGFALLEAIVAMTLLAVAMVPIYGLMTTTIDGAYRLAEVNRRSEAMGSALEIIRAVNPMETTDGSIDTGLYQVSWHAAPITPPVDGAGYTRGLSLYRIGMFEVEVWARDANGAEMAHFNLQQIGYQRVRDMSIPFSTPQQ